MEKSHSEDWYWLWRVGSRGCEGRDCGGKCLWRKARQPWKQGDTAESHVEGGAITIASLSPYISIGKWTTENLTHQRPDTLNYRLGPHPGAPFSAWCAQLQSGTLIRQPLCVPEAQINREGPQARDPSKCLNGLSYGDWLKRPSDRQLQEPWKKD